MSRKTPAQEADELREATRDAHAAMKDLRAAKKEIESLIARVSTVASEVFTGRIEEQIATTLNDFTDEMKMHTEALTASIDESIDRRWNKISDVLLDDSEGASDGTPSIARLAECWKEKQAREGIIDWAHWASDNAEKLLALPSLDAAVYAYLAQKGLPR